MLALANGKNVAGILARVATRAPMKIIKLVAAYMRG